MEPKKKIPDAPANPQPRRRLSPEDREQQIVSAAIALFSKRGFEASTHDIARSIGVTQPLLYRYFPTKEKLVDRVYDEVFVSRWNPEWEDWLADRSVSLEERLNRYLNDYARYVTRSEWVRIFMHAGLSHEGLHKKYLARLREKHFVVIARELRHEYGIPEPLDADAEDEEVELVWSMHSGVFYFGVRKWIYDLPTPKHMERLISMRVQAFLTGVPAVLKAQRSAPS